MAAEKLPNPDLKIPAGAFVVVARRRRHEQLAITETACWGPGRWPFVRRWMEEGRWTKKSAKARVLRVATEEDIRRLQTRVALPAEPVKSGS